MTLASSASFADSKPHYELLDGLRGVAALLVVFYHINEGFAFSAGIPVIEHFNHGYLAVDFFFLLSGFVLAYAYDDRLRNGKLTLRKFFTRRLIRLHPMVLMGALAGAVCFMLQGGVTWGGEKVATSMVMLALLCAMFFIPAVPGASHEVRGNGEMFPLNGPAWSLFFEYLGNLAYAFFIRRLSNGALAILTLLLGGCTAYFTIADVSGYGMFGVGWTLDAINFLGGSLRMLFPFSAGMLIQRNFRPMRVRGAFWVSSIMLTALFYVPYLPSPEGSPICYNGIFESFCILFMFPFLIWLAASGVTTDRFSTFVCKQLGDLSFPLYITHYPFMYLFYAWLMEQPEKNFSATWAVSSLTVAGCIAFAYLCLKLYDEPVRKRLGKRFS